MMSLGTGLCEHCAHARTITSGRGSQFLLCELAQQDRRFAKYPRLPVLECAGFQLRQTPDDEPDASQAAP